MIFMKFKETKYCITIEMSFRKEKGGSVKMISIKKSEESRISKIFP